MILTVEEEICWTRKWNFSNNYIANVYPLQSKSQKLIKINVKTF